MRAGETLFGEKGFSGVTVGEIERAAGLSPRAGGFYRHFKSKHALLVALAAERFETPRKLGLTDVFPLGDTRAELVYIARAYARLNRPGDRLERVLRDEAPRIPELAALLARAHGDLAAALAAWIGAKPACQGLDAGAVMEVTMMIAGGWLFYLSRRDEFAPPAGFAEEGLLRRWADHWAAFLDAPAAAGD
ncbi:MAG: hypothetical protein Tsb0010_11180 [Parvularculaceae bacterium]